MKNKLLNEIYLDFNGVTKNRSIEVNFKNKISKSKVYVSKHTGLVFHSSDQEAEKSLKKWSKNIFSKKINTSQIKYTSNNPIMKSRHYYSVLFINKHFHKKKSIFVIMVPVREILLKNYFV